MPYLMAVVWLTIPVAIATALVVKAPVPITLLSFLPALPMLSMLAVEVAGLSDFCRTPMASARRHATTHALFWECCCIKRAGFAAVRAVARELRGDRGWEKTAHTGLHLTEDTPRERKQRVVPGRRRPESRPLAPRAVRGGSRSPGRRHPRRSNGHGHG